MKGTSCEECAYFEYDEEEESYGCQFYFDEDDIARASLYGDRYICPHFQYKDEYRIVRKQFRSIKTLTKWKMFINIKMKNKGEKR